MAFTSTPAPVCSSNGFLSLFHMPCANDISAQILHEIFGNSISNLIPGMAAFPKQVLIPSFIQNFNLVLLSGALFIFAIIVIAGTINTGHQGKFLGQQWDSIWTPIRVIGGTACMVPLKYGIAASQIIVLTLILYGVHAATTVWSTSLSEVNYGTAPTVPASGMDMVKQAIANDLIMQTYQAISSGKLSETSIPSPAEYQKAPPSDPSIPQGEHRSTIDFFSPAAQSLQDEAQILMPQLCKAALGLYTNTLLPDSEIVGEQSTWYSTCKNSLSNFLNSGKPFFKDMSVPPGSINGAKNPPFYWVGQLPGYMPCLDTGQLTPSCTAKMFYTGDGSALPFFAIPFTMQGHHYLQNIVSISYGKGTPLQSLADGKVLVRRNFSYIPAVNPSKALQNLQANILTFVSNNITASKCRSLPSNGAVSPYPAPKGCSNNINSIINAFNQYLKTQSNMPKEGYSLDGNQIVPTANKNNNPFTANSHQPLDSSWWNAGEVYLMVDQKMADNLSKMYQQLSGLNADGAIPSFLSKEKLTTAIGFLLKPLASGNKFMDGASIVLKANIDSTSAPTLWANYIDQYSTQPIIYNMLNSFPQSDTLALYILALKLQQIDAKDAVYVFTRLFQVMVANDMLDNGEYQSELPVKNAINKIFSGLLGSNTTGDSITSLMTEVYNIGVTKSDYGFIGKNLSVIQNAQRTGMDMIATTINSIDSIYNHYQNKYNDLRKQITNIGEFAGGTAAALSTAAITAGFGGPFSAASAAALGAGAEVAAQTGQMSIQIITMLKMSDILQSLMWLPIVIIVLTALFTAGVSFALVLPLMPFILFWAGQVAWILGCLEAVIAAPFLMMTLILPGGHHFAGHSVPGLRMLLGIIFRPLLMVLGLLVGLVLTYIVISFSADAFHVVAVTLIGGSLGDNATTYPGIIPNIAAYQDARGVIACLMLFLYCSFLMMAFQKCFSPIYLLPEKVIQMMGGQADKAGEQDLQQLQQGVNQQSQSMAQAGGQSLNKGIEAQQQKTQSQSKGWESGTGAASRPSSMAKSALYDKEAWQRQKDASAPGPAGLQTPGADGNAQSQSPGQSPDETAVAAQAAQKRANRG